jgi:hypothetical protein
MIFFSFTAQKPTPDGPRNEGVVRPSWFGGGAPAQLAGPDFDVNLCDVSTARSAPKTD